MDPSDPPASRLRRALLRGPLPRLPRVLDAASEGWWRLPARVRLLALVLLAALVVAGIVARTSRSPWGPPTTVVVATADRSAGEQVTARTTTRPAAVVPDDALATVPAGRLARDVTAGEVLTRAHVADDLDDLLETGEVAIALAQELPRLPAGARLDLLGTGFDGTGTRLGSGRLLAVDDAWTWVALDRATAPGVAAAMATGQVTVALAPGG